jgi:hypothetical protein
MDSETARQAGWRDRTRVTDEQELWKEVVSNTVEQNGKGTELALMRKS